MRNRAVLYTLTRAAMQKAATFPGQGEGDVMGPTAGESLENMTDIPGQASWPKPDDRIPPFQPKKTKDPLDPSYVRVRLHGG